MSKKYRFLLLVVFVSVLLIVAWLTVWFTNRYTEEINILFTVASPAQVMAVIFLVIGIIVIALEAFRVLHLKRKP